MISEELRARVDTLLARTLCDRTMQEHRSILTYLPALLRRARLWLLWTTWLSRFRRLRLVTYILKTLSFLWVILQTGTLVILFTALFLVILPLLTALLLGILITAWVESRRATHAILECIGDRPVCILFLGEESGAFFGANARDLVARGMAVLVVSPYWFSSKGLRRGHFYCTARHEEEGILLLRRYYFFSLKRRLPARQAITVCY